MYVLCIQCECKLTDKDLIFNYKLQIKKYTCKLNDK